MIKNINLYKSKHPKVHFIGIGGKGLNGIAKICIKKGFKVSGSDLNQSKETESIKKLGAKVYYKHSEMNIVENPNLDFVIRSSIIREDHPEVVEAIFRGIPVYKRSEFLGELIKSYEKIAIIGSHGKSTTTALVGLALQFAGDDPTIFGGAHIKEIGSFERLGMGKRCVVEACEYDRSFMNLVGDISIFTSLEKSHLEYYKDEKEMEDSFKSYIKKHSKDSMIIANGDNIKIKKMLFSAKCETITYGFNGSNDYVIKKSSFNTNNSTFSVYKGKDKIIENISIKIPGEYNVLNFTALIVLFDQLGFSQKFVLDLANIFTGIGRRFEIHPINDILTFVDDFSHHPTQVKNLFHGIKQFYPDHKICAVFQPRQYHLIKSFLKEYGEAFKYADSVMITDIVPALGDTEKDKQNLEILDVINSVKKYSHKNREEVKYVKTFPEVVRMIKNDVKDKTIVTTIGAGDVFKIKDYYLNSV